MEEPKSLKFLLNYLHLCEDEHKSYGFGSTWGCVIDHFFLFGWTIPLMVVTLMCGCSRSFLPLYSSLYIGFNIPKHYVHLWRFCWTKRYIFVGHRAYFLLYSQKNPHPVLHYFIFQSQCLFFIGGAAGGSWEGTVFLPKEQLSTPYYSQSGGKRTQYQGERLNHDNKTD